MPGLVIAYYSNNKARDRSQYESFIPYHQALYRAVEPTSARLRFACMERARARGADSLSSGIGAGLSGNDGARQFDRNRPLVADAIESLRQRMLSAEQMIRREDGN